MKPIGSWYCLDIVTLGVLDIWEGEYSAYCGSDIEELKKVAKEHADEVNNDVNKYFYYSGKEKNTNLSWTFVASCYDELLVPFNNGWC